MRDIIESAIVPGIQLAHIYRQSENAMISLNAKKIKSGDTSICDGDDFHFVETSSLEDIKNAMAAKYVEYVNMYGASQVFCLCPYNNYTAGVKDMNRTLQALINPAGYEKKEVRAMGMIFREGDSVMHIRVNTDKAVNGDVGQIAYIEYTDNDEETYEVHVVMNDRDLVYTKANIMNLTLAYAMSVYKSQGAEAKAVVTCLTMAHSAMLFMNIPYVAITRGSEDVTFFGERKALDNAVTVGTGRRRITLLRRRLLEEAGEYVEVGSVKQRKVI